MLVTSTSDGPVTNTHSKVFNTVDTTPEDTMPTSTNDKVKTPPTLTADQKDTLRLMQRMDPFCKCIFYRILRGKVPSLEANRLTHIKGIIYKHVVYSDQRFLALVIPKSWHFTVYIEAHEKLGYQGINMTNHLVKHENY